MNAVGAWSKNVPTPPPRKSANQNAPSATTPVPVVRSSLSMYQAPPSEDITLDDFERLALGRIKVLKMIEDMKLRSKGDKEILAALKEEIDRQGKGLTMSPDEELSNDIVSHYILRLAYCRTAELRKWLLTTESEWFRLRFGELLPSQQEAFLKASQLPFSQVPEKELSSELMDQLLRVMRANLEKAEIIRDARDTPCFYKVHFTKVPDLVGQRRVLLIAGFAYVSRSDVASLVMTEFRQRLSKGLADVSRSWRSMFPDSDERLRPLVASLSSRYLGTDYSSGANTSSCEVTAQTLPELSARHFPLCMTSLMTHLSADRHLRHGGRQQLSLFLKGVGLPLEEALIFWRTSFAPRYSSEAFDKEFAYNVRHGYGKEGKRTEYSAHNCVSIIRMSGGNADHHGCPFKRADDSGLRGLLTKAKCSDKLTAEALQKAKGGHYQLACACAFEGVHGVATDIGISHPLQYFSESQRLAQAAKVEQEGGAAAVALTNPEGPQPVDDPMVG